MLFIRTTSTSIKIDILDIKQTFLTCEHGSNHHLVPYHLVPYRHLRIGNNRSLLVILDSDYVTNNMSPCPYKSATQHNKAEFWQAIQLAQNSATSTD